MKKEKEKDTEQKEIKEKEQNKIEETKLESSNKTTKITKKDVILMLIITFIYSVVSFINLGTLTNPQTFWKTGANEKSAIFKIKQGTTQISKIRFYSETDFDICFSYNGKEYSNPITINEDKTLGWQDYPISISFDYAKITGKSNTINVGEIALYDINDNKLEVIAVNNEGNMVIDEQDSVPTEINELNEKPQTFWKADIEEDGAVIRIEQGKTNVSNIRYYSGTDFGDFQMYFSYDGENYSNPITLSEDKVFAWKDFGITGDFEYVKIIGNKAGIYLGEVAIFDENNNKLDLIGVNEIGKLLVDEQNTVPDEISYLNSTYFDEIYFARTAYEHLHNLPIYEWTHPPLGKLLMAIPISMFGMTTFSYRLMGNIAGILMIPAIYCLAKMLFKDSKYAVLAAIIMAVDGMHFVQSRLGTADGFLVLFIILEYLFMYKYIISGEKPLKKRLWYLFFSGLFMGCAIATKWTGVFAAIGLALVFFFNMAIKKFVKKEKWTKEDTIIIFACCGFFILIPLIIYFLSYIPYYIVENASIKDLKTFVAWQEQMYNYHHDLVATHPYSSMWYTWPITKQSILYWVGTTNSGAVTRIALLGNPAIWWFSIPCLVYVLISAIVKRKFEYWFLIIPIISMMISYVGIDRIMFLYHYFPVLPFVMLSIVAFIKWFCEGINNNVLIYIFVAVIVIVFIYFYPIYSGFPTSYQYINDLKWLKTWIW